MKDKELNLEDVKDPSHTMLSIIHTIGEWGEREGKGTQALSLSSGTHRIQNSLTEQGGRLSVVVYYESIKRELKTKPIYW